MIKIKTISKKKKKPKIINKYPRLMEHTDIKGLVVLFFSQRTGVRLINNELSTTNDKTLYYSDSWASSSLWKDYNKTITISNK